MMSSTHLSCHAFFGLTVKEGLLPQAVNKLCIHRHRVVGFILIVVVVVIIISLLVFHGRQHLGQPRPRQYGPIRWQVYGAS